VIRRVLGTGLWFGQECFILGVDFAIVLYGAVDRLKGNA